MKRTAFAGALAAGVLILAAQSSPPIAAAPSAAPAAAATRNPQVTARRGMVASAHTLASQAGLEILKAGGNAVDAAVAAAFAIGVVEPNASGLGGEGMMVLYLAGTQKAVAIDYRFSAPASVDYPGAIPETGHAAVAVPGTVAGLTMALEKYGTMKLPRVLAPAIRLAEQGFVVGPTLAGIVIDNFEAIGTPGAARIVSTMTLLVSNLVDFGMGIQEAIEAPRFYARDSEADLSVEARMPAATVEALTKMGYRIKMLGEYDLFFGGAQGIVIDHKTGLRIGGADPRRDGAVVGY